MNEIELVVFDLAGTTVEDRGQVPTAFTAALSEFGIDVTPEHVHAVRGASKREAIARLVAGHGKSGNAGMVYDAFRSRLEEEYAAGVQSIPGAEQTFAWLREHGVRVALNTGFDRDITDLLMRALGWRDAVDTVVCGDDVPEGRPAPHLIHRAMEETKTRESRYVANVGDTTLDLQAGRNAGVRYNVAVLTGAHTRAQLEAQRPTHLIASVTEIPTLWSKG